MNFSLTRGDTFQMKFKRQFESTKEDITQKPDKMYMTFKRNEYEEDYVLQKKLSDGSITYNEEDHYYYLTLKPEDTNSLDYGSYVFDIEVIKDGIVKTIQFGKMTITREITFANNEED